MPGLRFGWFIPTAGDTTAYGDRSASIGPNLDHFVRVAIAAEAAGFEYTLVPVDTACYEAWVTCSFVAAKTTRLKQLIAARPGLIGPTQMAKMVSTFDQLSQGRISVNLIAGGGYAEMAADGVFQGHDERYEVMDEAVTLMKRCWTEQEPIAFEGKHFRVENAVVRPRPFQKPHPPFYIGGVSPAAKRVGAKHADVYFLWGDTRERIAAEIASIRSVAIEFGRAESLQFGLRIQVLVRETETEAWRAAEALVANVTDSMLERRGRIASESRADGRMKEIAASGEDLLAPHLWTGITRIRHGAGVVIVGNPEQVAQTLQGYVDLGCVEFCLSGYPHHEEAERFGRLVMPYFAGTLAPAR